VATRKRKHKRKSHWFRRAVARWAWRQVRNWAAVQRSRIAKPFRTKVIHASAKQHVFERQFPDPRRQPPLPETIERVEEWTATFDVELDNGWVVPFTVDVYDRRTSLREAAYDAAVLAHGEIARSRPIVDIRATNDLADEIMLEEK
jgi:hypothetical protein